jgi:DNA polymerase I
MATINPTIQIIDVDYFNDNTRSPVIRIFGKDSEGKSVCCFVPGFEPYFYAKAKDPKDLCDHLSETEVFPQVKRTEIVQRFHPIGYQTQTKPYVKIIVNVPSDVKDIREDVKALAGVEDIFEADTLFHNRYLIDKELHSMNWVSITQAPIERTIHQENILCDYTITADDVHEIERLVHAPLKYMAWDIECLPVDGEMPTPDKSPVIMMSMAFSPSYNGHSTLILVAKIVPDVNPDVMCFDDEPGMLNEFFRIIREYDPDVITGFNINDFDTPYVVDRCKFLFDTTKSNINTSIGKENRNFSYRKFAQTTQVSITGRIVADVLPLIRADFKLKRYKLEVVAKELLGKEKLDVPPSEMEAYWNDPVKIHHFIDYSRRDSELALELLLSLQLLDKYIALAQSSGRPLQDVISGGQTNLVEQLLMSSFRHEGPGRLMAMKPDDDEIEQRKLVSDTLKGADVLEPIKGLHNMVVVMDYKSLYPTIMMARNLCYTTVILDPSTPNEMINVSPSSGRFIKPEIYKGVIPRILEGLLDKRVKTKNLMKNTSDPNEKRVLDATQLALKILLNSFYGYSGYIRARLYSLDVGNAVTSYGRSNIHNSIEVIHKETGSLVFRNDVLLTPLEAVALEDTDMIINLAPVYGDTDSLFIHLTDINGNEFTTDEDFSLELSAKVGQKIAKIATEKLPAPMELQYETTAKRLLLIAKKRYAMWQFDKAKDGWSDKIKVKGLETVRRDWCNFTSNTQKQVLEIILKEGNVDKCIEYIHSSIDNLKSINQTRDTKILSELVLSKTLSRKPEHYKTKQAHVVVYEKLKERKGQLPAIGERIPYYIIEVKKFGAKNAEKVAFIDKAEDVSYVIEKNLPLDVNYYVTKQMVPPLLRLLETFNVTEEMLNVDKKQKGLFDFDSKSKAPARTPSMNTGEESITEESQQTKSQKSLFDY